MKVIVLILILYGIAPALLRNVKEYQISYGLKIDRLGTDSGAEIIRIPQSKNYIKFHVFYQNCLYNVWSPPSGYREGTFHMLAHIHCSLFVCLANPDLLTAINCPVDHSQHKSRISGQLERELKDRALPSRINAM
jgi:hypothetical protein